MTEPDELISKADALLSRWRSNSVAPSPPEDYPVLTEIVETQVPEPAQEHLPSVMREILADPAMPDLGAAEPGPRSAIELPVLESDEAPTLQDAVGTANSAGVDQPLAPNDDLPVLPEIELLADESDLRNVSMEERLCSEVLASLEPRLAECVEAALSEGIDELRQELTQRITIAMRQNVDALVREAVTSALRLEANARQDAPSTGR